MHSEITRLKWQATKARSKRRPDKQHKTARSSLMMYNVYVDGHRTTVRLEPVIWDAMQSIARQERIGLHDLVSTINRNRIASSLTSAIRAYVVTHLMVHVPVEELPSHLFQKI